MKPLPAPGKLLFLAASFAFLFSHISYGQYDLGVTEIKSLPDTAYFFDTTTITLVVMNQDTSPFSGNIDLYFMANNNTSTLTILTSFTATLNPGDTVSKEASLTFSPSTFDTGGNIIAVWPVDGGINIDPGNDTIVDSLIVLYMVGTEKDKFLFHAPISFYPNPSAGTLHIVPAQPYSSRPVQVTIYALDGRLLHQMITTGAVNINLSERGILPGNYLLEFLLPDGKKYISSLLFLKE